MDNKKVVYGDSVLAEETEEIKKPALEEPDEDTKELRE